MARLYKAAAALPQRIAQCCNPTTLAGFTQHTV